jgi:hypothetical protein
MTSSISGSELRQASDETARSAGFAAGILYLCLVAVILVGVIVADAVGRASTFRFDGSSSDGAVQLTIGHRFGDMFKAKVSHVLSVPPRDILSIGNHLMGGFRLPADWHDGDTAFNIASTGSPNDELLQIVRVLEAHGKLPRKLLLVTMLPHNPIINTPAYDVPFAGEFGRGDDVASWNGLKANLARLSTNLTYYLSYVAVLDSLAGASGKIIHLDMARCAETFRTSADQVTAIERLKLKAAMYLPTEFLLGAGIIDIDLMCREKSLFHQIDMNSVRGDGSHPYSTPIEINFHSPYAIPPMDAAKVASEAQLAATTLRQVAEIGARGGARVVFLVSPRRELPLDGDNDRVLNLAFKLAPELVVIDHRRLSLDASLSVDGSHPNDTYVSRHLAPCLRRILNGEHLEEYPAVEGKGRTIC